MGRRTTLTPLISEKILRFLGDGSCPFLALAAERAGVTRHQAKAWLLSVEAHDSKDPVLVHYATEVRRIRAEWSAKITREIQACEDKGQSQASRNKAWLLERVDRDMFDLGTRYLPKKEQPKPPELVPIEHSDMNQVISDLEKPDQDGTSTQH